MIFFSNKPSLTALVSTQLCPPSLPSVQGPRPASGGLARTLCSDAEDEGVLSSIGRNIKHCFITNEQSSCFRRVGPQAAHSYCRMLLEIP